jgi:hypothetical protein
MKKLLSVSISAAVLAMGASSAMASTVGEVLEASGVAANGYLAGGYYYYDADAMALNAFQNGVNGFDLQQAAITVAKKPAEGFGGVVNLTAGSNAKPIASVGTTADDFDVTQAYLQYATGGLTVMGGKFATLMGAEVIDSTVNTNISRSLGFFNAIAYTHTGVRATYAITDTFSVTGGLNNGWDQQQDANDGKTVELGVAWNPSAMFGLLAQAYSGEEVADATLGYNARRDLIDVVATVKPVDGLSLVLDVTSATQKEATGFDTDSAKWMAVAAYVNYAFNEQWRVSFRGEQFDDKDNYKLALGSNPDGQKVKSATFTVGYAPVPNFELRAEVRGDKADDEVFTKDGDATDTVKFAGLEGVFKF